MPFAYERMGQALVHLRQWDEAKKAIDGAIAIGERLAAADPNNGQTSAAVLPRVQLASRA